MTQRTCRDCPTPVGPRKRLCDVCRVKARRESRRPPAAEQPPASAEPPLVSGGLTLSETVVAQLVKANRLETIAGQQALELARRMQFPAESGSGVAALSRELRTVLAEALADAGEADPVDQLRERRDRKAREASG